MRECITHGMPLQQQCTCTRRCACKQETSTTAIVLTTAIVSTTNSSNKKSNNGMIVGIVIVSVLIGIVVVAILCYYRNHINWTPDNQDTAQSGGQPAVIHLLEACNG